MLCCGARQCGSLELADVCEARGSMEFDVVVLHPVGTREAQSVREGEWRVREAVFRRDSYCERYGFELGG